ncbi:MAG TPA: hypothetical protein DGG94_10695, partial [Micromonosporaceae bacterium]|nr:hypothetical protein [Micromonosporaceae bacterium]
GEVREVVVKATGSAKLRVGRVFLYDGDKGRYQKMILAGAARQDVSAQVKASFTPGLPQTGDNVTTYVASGTGIAALGAVVFMLARRRLVRLRRLAS